MDGLKIQGGKLADKLIPDDWIGQDVVIDRIGTFAAYGRLEDINLSGIALRHWVQVDYPTGKTDYPTGKTDHWVEYQYDSVKREVVNFYPWHSLKSFRLQEDEEKRVYGIRED